MWAAFAAPGTKAMPGAEVTPGAELRKSQLQWEGRRGLPGGGAPGRCWQPPRSRSTAMAAVVRAVAAGAMEAAVVALAVAALVTARRGFGKLNGSSVGHSLDMQFDQEVWAT